MPSVRSNLVVPLSDLLPEESTSTTQKTESFRTVCVKCGVFEGQRGSAYAEFGKTRVIAQVIGPREGDDFYLGTVSVAVSGYEEKRIRAQLTSVLAATIQLSKYAKSLIHVSFSVLSNDGGVLQTALIAGSLALVHAGIEVLDVCLACSVSVEDNGFVVDPSGEEKGQRVTVAIMPNLNQIVCCESQGAMTASKSLQAVDFATKKALVLYPVVRKAIIAAV